MPTITLTISLKEAEAVCMALSRVDPLGVWTGKVIKQIDEEAKKAIANKDEKK